MSRAEIYVFCVRVCVNRICAQVVLAEEAINWITQIAGSRFGNDGKYEVLMSCWHFTHAISSWMHCFIAQRRKQPVDVNDFAFVWTDLNK